MSREQRASRNGAWIASAVTGLVVGAAAFLLERTASPALICGALAFAYSRALLWGAVRFRIAGWWRAALLGGLLGIVGYVLCSASMGFALFVTNASSATGRLEDPILGSFGPINFVLFWVLTLAFASYGVLPLLATCLGMIAFMLCRRPRHAHA